MRRLILLKLTSFGKAFLRLGSIVQYLRVLSPAVRKQFPRRFVRHRVEALPVLEPLAYPPEKENSHFNAILPGISVTFEVFLPTTESLVFLNVIHHKTSIVSSPERHHIRIVVSECDAFNPNFVNFMFGNKTPSFEIPEDDHRFETEEKLHFTH